MVVLEKNSPNEAGMTRKKEKNEAFGDAKRNSYKGKEAEEVEAALWALSRAKDRVIAALLAREKSCVSSSKTYFDANAIPSANAPPPPHPFISSSARRRMRRVRARVARDQAAGVTSGGVDMNGVGCEGGNEACNIGDDVQMTTEIAPSNFSPNVSALPCVKPAISAPKMEVDPDLALMSKRKLDRLGGSPPLRRNEVVSTVKTSSNTPFVPPIRVQPKPFEVSAQPTMKATWVDRVSASSRRAPSIISDDDSIDDDDSFDEGNWAKWEKEASMTPRSTKKERVQRGFKMRA